MAEGDDFDVDVEEGQGDDEGPAPRGAGRLIVVGGGRGGVGKSVIAESLAVYFAQLGKAVILVDADPTGTNIHSHFGLSAARTEPTLEALEAGRDVGDRLAAWNAALVPTLVPGLRLLPAAHDSIDVPMALRASRKSRWLSRLCSLQADYFVVDVGPGHGPVTVDLLLAADLAVVVTVPEPPAIETTYRFIRAAFVRRVRRSLLRDKFRLGLFDRVLRQIGYLPPPIELVRALTRAERELALLAWTEAKRMRLHLVVNQTRVRADQDLGHQMCDLSNRHYGIALDELGHVEHDDTVWLAVRRNRPLLIDSPASKAARNVERIARRVLALVTARATPGVIPTAIPLERPTLYDALGVTRSSNDEEVRRAYKRVREMYAPGSLATASLLAEPDLAVERTRLEEAYDTLLDPLRRRAYDLSTFTDNEGARPGVEASPKPAIMAEQLMLQHELAREIGPETEFTGALLRKVREAYGVEVSDISERTKIGKAYLVAIEEEDFASLPALVYVRGFVAELAKFLRLDPPQVQRTFLRRMRERAGGRGRDSE